MGHAIPLDEEEDEEDDEDDEDDEDELLLDDEDDDDTSPEEDELLLDDETSPDEDELLELEDELFVASAPPVPPIPPVPAIPPIPLLEDDVPLAAPAPVVVTGWASLHAPPNVAAQMVTNPVNRANFFTAFMGDAFISDWGSFSVCTMRFLGKSCCEFRWLEKHSTKYAMNASGGRCLTDVMWSYLAYKKF